jgi:uncharacterized membrane protein
MIILGMIVVSILFGLFYIILRALVLYSICRDMSEKEQDEYLKAVEEAEARDLFNNRNL